LVKIFFIEWQGNKVLWSTLKINFISSEKYSRRLQLKV
jgi:hypothetical protein